MEVEGRDPARNVCRRCLALSPTEHNPRNPLIVIIIFFFFVVNEIEVKALER